MIPIDIINNGVKLKANLQRITILNIGIHIITFFKKMFKVRTGLILTHDKSQKVITRKAMVPVPEKRTKEIRALPINPPPIKEMALVTKRAILNNNP